MANTRTKTRYWQRQEKFLEEYIANGFRATTAAITAGYSKKGANSKAAQLLARVSIQQRLAVKLEPLLRKYSIDQDRVMQELVALGFGRITDVCEFGPGGVTMKQDTELSDEAIATISEVSDHFGSDGRQGIRVKLHDKLKALDKLTQIMEMVKDHRGGGIQATQINVLITANGKPVEANIVRDV